MTYTNSVTGEIKKMTFAEMMQAYKMNDIFVEAVKTFAENARQAKKQITHLVLFENQQMDSIYFGHQQLLAIGPDMTYKTMEEVQGGRLGDVPSRFLYPVAYCDMADVK